MKLSDSQIKRALRMADEFQKADGSTFKAFHEFEHVDSDGSITESEYLTTARGAIKQDDIVLIDGVKHRVMFVKDDRSGLVDAYISIVGGSHGKYR